MTEINAVTTLVREGDVAVLTLNSPPVNALSAKVRGMPGVADVRYDRQWLTRLLAAVVVIRGVGLALAAVLTFAAALTVANVVRLGLYARRDELEIMQLVGAPQAYIHFFEYF